MSTYQNKIITANEKKYRLISPVGENNENGENNKDNKSKHKNAQGGNGDVWIAEDLETTQQYAVKFLREQQSKKIARFEKEITFCQQENHPNIVKVIGRGTFDDGKRKKLFYIMPLYQKTLRKVINEETNPDILLDYWIKLAKAVEYIHSIHVYHRDIKPENIFVNKSGELVLADFGIAHFHGSNMTKTSEWLGNKSYAAPEQLEKENDNQVSAFSDIYALGKILNELFTKNNPSGLSYKLICDLYPQYWQLDMVVEKCLNQNPLERPSCKTLLGKVTHIMEKVDSDLHLIEDVLIDDLEHEQVNESVMATARIAAKDIYWAQYFLENASLQEISNRDKATEFSYHQNIHYALDDFIKSVYFQKRILNLCEKKFEYESNNYDRGIFYDSIDLADKDNKKLYDTFCATVTKYRYPDYSLGKTLKYFLACCDYHCKEILESINEIEEELIKLSDVPYFYLLYKLRKVFSRTEAKEYDIADRILVNWERTYTKAYFS